MSQENNSSRKAIALKRKIIFQKRLAVVTVIFLFFVVLGAIYYAAGKFIGVEKTEKIKRSEIIEETEEKIIPVKKPEVSIVSPEIDVNKIKIKKRNKTQKSKKKQVVRKDFDSITELPEIEKKEYDIDSLLVDLYSGRKTKKIKRSPGLHEVDDYLKLSLVYIKKGLVKKAIQILEKGREKHYSSGKILLLLARSYIDTGNIKAAEDLLSELGKELKGYPAYLKNLTQYRNKISRIYIDNYNISEKTDFFTIKFKKIYNEKKIIHGLKWNKTKNLLIYFIKDKGAVIIDPHTLQMRNHADVFEIDFSKRGTMYAKYSGLQNNKIELGADASLSNLLDKIEMKKSELLRFSISQSGDYMAVYKKNGKFDLIDSSSGMSRYSFDRKFSPGVFSNPFAFVEEDKIKGSRRLYYLFKRDKEIISIANMDLNAYEEKRIFSLEIENNDFQGLDLVPGKFVLFSALKKKNKSPSIYIMGHFGKNSMKLLDNCSYPVISNSHDIFYFTRKNKIFAAKIIPVSEESISKNLMKLDPEKAAEELENLLKKKHNQKLSEVLDKIKTEKYNQICGRLYYEAQLFNDLKLYSISRLRYNTIINDYPENIYTDAAIATLDKIDILLETEKQSGGK